MAVNNNEVTERQQRLERLRKLRQIRARRDSTDKLDRLRELRAQSRARLEQSASPDTVQQVEQQFPGAPEGEVGAEAQAREQQQAVSFFPVDPDPNEVAERFGFAPQVGAPQFIQEILAEARKQVRENPDAEPADIVENTVRGLSEAGANVPIEVAQFLEPAAQFAREIEFERPERQLQAALARQRDQFSFELPQRTSPFPEPAPIPGATDRAQIGRPVELDQPEEGARPPFRSLKAELAARAEEAVDKTGTLDPAKLYSVYEETYAGRRWDPEQVMTRFSAGYAQELINMPLAVANELRIPELTRDPTFHTTSDGKFVWEKPEDFSVNLIRRMEEDGILREASQLERWSQMTGQATAAIQALVVGGGALGVGARAAQAPEVAAGLARALTGAGSNTLRARAIDAVFRGALKLGPVRLAPAAQVSEAAATTMMLTLQNMVSSRQALRDQGLDPDEVLGPEEYASMGRGAMTVPILGAAGNELVAAVGRLRGSPLGAAASRFMQTAWFAGAETALGATVRGQTLPEAAEHGTSLALSLLLGGGFDALFKGSHRPRTVEGVREGLNLTADILRERGLVEQGVRPPKAKLQTEQRVRIARARAHLQNRRAKADGTTEKLPTPGSEEAAIFARDFNITEPEAARLITEVNKMGRRALDQIRDSKVKEAMLILAERDAEVTAVGFEAARQMEADLGLLSKAEKLIWRRTKQGLTEQDQRAIDQVVEFTDPAFARESLKEDPMLEAAVGEVIQLRKVIRAKERAAQAQAQRDSARRERQAEQILQDARRLAELQRTERRIQGEPEGFPLVTEAEAARRGPSPERRAERLIETEVTPETRQIGQEPTPEVPTTELPRGEKTRFVTPKGEVRTEPLPRQPTEKQRRTGSASSEKTLRKQLKELGFPDKDARELARNPEAAREILRSGQRFRAVPEPELTAKQEARLGRRAGKQEGKRRPRRGLIEAPETVDISGTGRASVGEIRFVLQESASGKRFTKQETGVDLPFVLSDKPPSPLVMRFILRAGGKLATEPTERVMRAIIKSHEFLGKQAFRAIEFSRDNPKADAIVDMIDRQRLPAEMRKALREADKTLEQERNDARDNLLDRLTKGELNLPILAIGVLSGALAEAAIDEDEVDPEVGLAALPFWLLFGRKRPASQASTVEKQYAKIVGGRREALRDWEKINKQHKDEARLAAANPRKAQRATEDIVTQADWGTGRAQGVHPFVIEVARRVGDKVETVRLSGPLIRRAIRVDPASIAQGTTPTTFHSDSAMRDGVLSISQALRELGPGGEILAVGLGDAISNRNARVNRLFGVRRNPESFGYEPWRVLDPRNTTLAADQVEFKSPADALKAAVRRGVLRKRGVPQQIAEAIESDKLVAPEHPEAVWRAEVMNRLKFGIKNAKHIGVKKGSDLEKDVDQFIRIWEDHFGGAAAEAMKFKMLDQLFLEEGGSYVPLMWEDRVHAPSLIDENVRWRGIDDPNFTPGRSQRIFSRAYKKRLDNMDLARRRVFEDAKKRGTRWWEQVARFESKKEAQEYIKENFQEEFKKNKQFFQIRKVTSTDLITERLAKTERGKYAVRWRRPITEADVNEYFTQMSEKRFQPEFNAPLDELAQRVGFLDNHRLLGQVGVERIWDPVKLMDRYFESAYQRLEEARAFKGKDMPLAQSVLAAMRKSNNSASERAKFLVDVGRGVHPNWTSSMRNSMLRMFAQSVSSGLSISELGLAGFSQFTSWARVPAHTNMTSAYKAFFERGEKALQNLEIGPPGQRKKLAKQEYDRFLAEHGHHLQSEFGVLVRDGSMFIPKMAGAFLTYNGTLPIDTVGRQFGILAGRHYFRILRMEYMHALRSGNARNRAKARARIRELFDDDAMARIALKRGNLSDLEAGMLQRQAGALIASRTSGRTEIIDMPAFAAHPYGQFLYKFMHFPYRMAAESHNEWSRMKRFPLKSKDASFLLRRIAAFVALTGGVSPGIQRLRQIIKTRDLDAELPAEDEAFLVQFIDWMSYAGYWSAYTDVFNGMYIDRYNRKLPRFLGPVIENAFLGIDAATRGAMTRDLYPVAAWAMHWIPEPFSTWMDVPDKIYEFNSEDPETLFEKWGIIPERVSEQAAKEAQGGGN